jgi:hypothetical protein
MDCLLARESKACGGRPLIRSMSSPTGLGISAHSRTGLQCQRPLLPCLPWLLLGNAMNIPPAEQDFAGGDHDHLPVGEKPLQHGMRL